MKLFWKIYLFVFMAATALICFVAYAVSINQISDARDNIIQRNKIVAHFLLKEMELGLLEGRWPFETLKELSEAKDFLFWWVIRPDGSIHLADKTSFLETQAKDYFPRVSLDSSHGHLLLDDDLGYGIFVEPLGGQEKGWSYWLGFSLRDVSRMKREIIARVAYVSLTALILLGIILYFVTQRFLRPIETLSRHASALGEGNLSERTKIETGDELGQLANSFNRMAENLQSTTVSKSYIVSIVESMDDLLMVLDPTGSITMANPAACRVLGYDQEELIGKPIEALFSETGGGLGRDRDLSEFITKGPLRNYEAEWETKSGKEVPILLSTSEITDKDGRISSTVVTAKDITERKRAEEGLRQSEEKHRTILASIEEGYYEVDLAGNMTFCNESLSRMLGYTKEELIGINNRAYMDANNAKRLYNAFNRVYSTGKPEGMFGWELAGKDGTPRDVRASVSLIRDSEGKPCGFRGVVRDVTERKKAEKALEESEERYRSLVENLNDVVYSLDMEGRISYISPSVERLSGYKTTELIGQSFQELVHPDDLPRLMERYQRILEGEIEPSEYRLLDKDGTEIHIRSYSRPVHKDGVPVGLSGLITDITEIKKVEEEREHLRSQIVQGQKMESIGTLTGGIAHDFNNLLTIINGYTELILSEKTEDDPLYEDLQKILETGLKGAELVKRLLALSKKGESEPQPIDLNSAVENSSKLMERTFPKSIEIETILQKDVAIVNADAVQVEQVLMNLCINAKEAMPEGGQLRIETRNTVVDEGYCRLHPGAKAGRHVLIEISDTGTGMSNELMERIFDPFFTSKGWDFKKGTGLGLSVAKGIVEQHGGWITCQSEPGVGTTFTVYFPAIEGSPAVQKPGPVAESVPGTEKILLVDDEEYVRDLGKRILERTGYTVITAANGKEALETYAREQSNIGLVVLDLIMPQMAGEKCLEELLKINPQVKVIVSSGHSLDARERLLLGALARGFVNKPYEVIQLVQAVKDALGLEGLPDDL